MSRIIICNDINKLPRLSTLKNIESFQGVTKNFNVVNFGK